MYNILLYYTVPNEIFQEIQLIFLQRGRKNYALFFVQYIQF